MKRILGNTDSTVNATYGVEIVLFLHITSIICNVSIGVETLHVFDIDHTESDIQGTKDHSTNHREDKTEHYLYEVWDLNILLSPRARDNMIASITRSGLQTEILSPAKVVNDLLYYVSVKQSIIYLYYLSGLEL